MEEIEEVKTAFKFLKARIGIFEEAVADWEEKEPREFIEKCSHQIDKIINHPVEKLEFFFKDARLTLKNILKDLTKSDFLSSLGFAVAEANYTVHWITKYVINGVVTIDPKLPGVNFKQNIKQFVIKCGDEVKRVLNCQYNEIVSQVERLNEKKEELSKENMWIIDLRDGFWD